MTNALRANFRVVDSATGKARAKSFKRIEWAQAHADHLTACHGRRFVVARVVAR